jgi:hypothetical protein
MLFVVLLLVAMLACGLPGLANPGSGGETQPALAPPESGGSGSVNSGACDNALYPVIAGASWTYSFTGAAPGDFKRSIVATTADGFTDQDVFDSGVTRTGQWKCEAGALVALEPGGGTGATANVQGSDINANFQTTSMDGVTFPAVVNPGTSWTQDFTIAGTQSINGQEVASKNQTTYTCTAGGSESVTVPAGTFEAVRVDCQTSVQITITMNGADIPTNASFTSTAWHAPGVGMVKTDSVLSDGSTSTIELTAYTIP